MFKYILFITSLCIFTSTAFAKGETKPECAKLEAFYVEIAKRAGHTLSRAEINESIGSQNPSNEECKAAVTLIEMNK